MAEIVCKKHDAWAFFPFETLLFLASCPFGVVLILLPFFWNCRAIWPLPLNFLSFFHSLNVYFGTNLDYCGPFGWKPHVWDEISRSGKRAGQILHSHHHANRHIDKIVPIKRVAKMRQDFIGLQDCSRSTLHYRICMHVCG